MKKEKWSKFRHKVIFTLLRFPFKAFFYFKYNLHLEKEKLPDEGAVILCNHTMALDPFIVGCKFNKPIYYMTSKDLFQNKFVGKLIRWLVNPIPKEKSNKGDLAAIKDCMKVSKENATICIFPEGNRTFTGKLGNVDPSIVKLIKLLKKPLIICNIIGGYSSDPRWSNKRRKGRIDIVTRTKLEYEEFKDMDNDEMYQMIVHDLTVDEYMLDIPFKGKKNAEYLESILHICPICKDEHCLISKGDHLYCSSCNLDVTYTINRTFESNNEEFKFKYVHEWYDYQIDVLNKRTYDDNTVIYEDNIEVYEPIMNQKKKYIGKGKMILYNDSFKFPLDKEELTLSFDDISAVTLLGRMKMNIYYKDKVYQVYNDRRTNLIKYMHVFYIIKNKKRGIENGFIVI